MDTVTDTRYEYDRILAMPISGKLTYGYIWDSCPFVFFLTELQYCDNPKHNIVVFFGFFFFFLIFF